MHQLLGKTYISCDSIPHVTHGAISHVVKALAVKSHGKLSHGKISQGNIYKIKKPCDPCRASYPLRTPYIFQCSKSIAMCMCVCEHLQVKTGKNKVTQQSPLTLKVHTLELIKTLYLTTFSHIQAPFSQWLFIQTFELPRYQKQAKQTCGQLQNELQLLQNGHLKAIQ